MFPTYLESLDQASLRIATDPAFDSSWLCKTGLWPDKVNPKAAVLKLLKRHWSQDAEDTLGSTSGFFFSVWIDDAAIKKGGLHYNLHALKLRQLADHKLESRKFALAFRAAFGPRSESWPGVTMAFGPQTLFQGFVRCQPKRFESVAFSLARKLVPLGTVIDDLLAGAAKV